LEPWTGVRAALQLGAPAIQSPRQGEPGGAESPLTAVARCAGSSKTAEICNEFLRQAREVLKNDAPANFLTMRGIDRLPHIPGWKSGRPAATTACARASAPPGH
jgi:2,3-bisphosphoglycerate-independent phosphoglycerate mutase